MAMNFESKVRCNQCMKVFFENEIVYDEDKDMEFCPYCGESGCLMDLSDKEFYMDLLMEQQEQM